MAGRLEGDREVRQVLGYWLGALRLEESLASRPRAHRPETPGSEARGETSSSQTYFRLGKDHAAFWSSARGEVHAEVDPSVQRFHRHWLRRIAWASRRTSAEGADGSAWIAGWPAVFFERRDEIATLVRFPVNIEWRLGGAPWELHPVTRRPVLRENPDVVVVRAVDSPDDDDPSPISIDRHLLHETLGLLDEEIAQLEVGWRDRPDPVRMISDLIRLLDPAGAGADPANLFQGLVQAVSRRLPRGVSVYPTGIIQDGALVFATHHLQRELVELASLPPGAAPLQPGTALWSFLTGAPNEPERALLRGRFRERGLTAGQRTAAELAVGSRLAAVQGPPGTGKTELILNLAAHALVDRIDGWIKGRNMRDGLLVVASTNNRAVDNAIDPIGSQIPEERLPLALRAGSQDTTKTTTSRELQRAFRWLAGQSDAGAPERLEEARNEFRRASDELGVITAPQVANMRRESRVRAIRRELAALPANPADERAVDTLRAGVQALHDALAKMEKSVRARRKVEALGPKWITVAAELLAPLSRLLPDLASSLPLPPAIDAGASKSEARAAWLDALEDAIDEVDDALRRLGPRRRKSIAQQRQELELELAELEGTSAAPRQGAETEREIEVRSHALFLLALEVRERWAIVNRSALLPALDRAVKAALEARTLRRLIDNEPTGGPGLRALYPVVGCTLLSLGNVFRFSPGEIDTLVVDEAGQCHPAYPVGGLGRARRALLIGDVQQLAPVVTISGRDEVRVRRAARVGIDDERFTPFVIHDRAATSAQALADRAVFERPTLTDHFRCQASIIALSDELCGYHLAVHTPARSLSATVRRLAAPVLFDDVQGEQVRARGSWANEAEAERLADLVVEMRAAGLSLSEVGVLTPYVGQLDLLRQLLRRRGIPLEAGRDEPDAQLSFAPQGDPGVLSIGTVHRFQGGERSVILLSTAITRPQDLTFIDERANLLNVAISRARVHLVTFGCEEVLRAGRHTALLVERAQRLRR